MWVECFKKGGIAVLQDLTRPGRPKVERSEMEWIMGEASKSRIATVALQDIRQKTRPPLHATYARKLMHRYALPSRSERKSA